MKPGDMDDNGRGNGEALLEKAFAAARRDAPVPDADLMRRIMADAEEVQAGFSRLGEGKSPKRRVRLGALLLDAVGGYRGLGGLAAASAFGLWIGLSPSLGLSDYAVTAVSGAGLEAASAFDADYAYFADLGEL